ncbi:MAG TPA: LacI family DNA-binding transcriptional regulator [Trueperaceae bacterium]|nr:LacI family DNA-binding transcriptional regulator [Trueperaceae bacterium]
MKSRDTSNAPGIATVSRVLNEERDVSAATRQRVLDERLEGFREALDEHGVALLATGIAAGGDSWDGGYFAMQRILASGLVPDGVLAANDPAALSAYRALHQAGLRVPDDVKVIGFDDIHLAAQAEPPLTTIRVEKQELGRLGARRLLGCSGRASQERQGVQGRRSGASCLQHYP